MAQRKHSDVCTHTYVHMQHMFTCALGLFGGGGRSERVSVAGNPLLFRIVRNLISECYFRSVSDCVYMQSLIKPFY